MSIESGQTPTNWPTPEELGAAKRAEEMLLIEDIDYAYLCDKAMRTCSPPPSLEEVAARREKLLSALDSFGWGIDDIGNVPIERLEEELEAAFAAEYALQDELFPEEQGDPTNEEQIEEDVSQLMVLTGCTREQALAQLYKEAEINDRIAESLLDD